MTIARGSHPFPSRTRKLSLSAPIVLHAQVCGRLGSRPVNLIKPNPSGLGFFSFWHTSNYLCEFAGFAALSWRSSTVRTIPFAVALAALLAGAGEMPIAAIPIALSQRSALPVDWAARVGSDLQWNQDAVMDLAEEEPGGLAKPRFTRDGFDRLAELPGPPGPLAKTLLLLAEPPSVLSMGTGLLFAGAICFLRRGLRVPHRSGWRRIKLRRPLRKMTVLS